MGGCCSSTPSVVVNPARVDMSHFELLKVVGKGGFGKVNACENRNDKRLYAIKTLKKSLLLTSEAHLRTIWIERSVMAQFKSPFLVHLYWAFQDDQYLYLVMNFMKGGDLRYYLDKHGPMPESTCRFYVAELLLAVEEMNSLGLVYRDLKPENILLDEDGHLRLSDFGLVYDLKNTSDGMTSGEAGTRGYLSPEVLTGRYGFTQDVWSYGITIYELLHQSLPFKSRDEVLSGELRFERDLSPECRSLLRGLLEKHPKNRLGCDPKHKWAAIKKHPWFKGIDWDTAHNRGLKPPYIPEPDVAHCSAVFDLEEQFFGDEKKEVFTDDQQARFKNFEYRVDQTAPPTNSYAPTSLGGPTSPNGTNLDSKQAADQSPNGNKKPTDKSFANAKASASNANGNNNITSPNGKEKTYNANNTNVTSPNKGGAPGVAQQSNAAPTVIAAWPANAPSTAPSSQSVSPAPISSIPAANGLPPSLTGKDGGEATPTITPTSSAAAANGTTITATTTQSGGSPRLPTTTSAAGTTASVATTIASSAPITPQAATVTAVAPTSPSPKAATSSVVAAAVAVAPPGGPTDAATVAEIKHLSIAEEQVLKTRAATTTTRPSSANGGAPAAAVTATVATNGVAASSTPPGDAPVAVTLVAPSDDAAAGKGSHAPPPLTPTASLGGVVAVVEVTPGVTIAPVVIDPSSSSPKSSAPTKEAAVIDAAVAAKDGAVAVVPDNVKTTPRGQEVVASGDATVTPSPLPGAVEATA